MKLAYHATGKILLPLIMALLVGVSAGVLISNYTIIGEDLDFRLLGSKDKNSEQGDHAHSDSGQTTAKPAEKEILYWVAPMDPNYRRDEPGKSPMGMDLVPVYASSQDIGNAVHVSSAVQQSLGVRTSKAERRSLFRKIEATGYVGLDETRVSQINLRTEGWIERLLIKNEGEQVTKGQLLLELYSPQMVNTQKEYVQAKRRNDQQMVAATAEKLLALGMQQGDIERLDKTSKVSQTIRVLAPQDGTVTSLNVKQGNFVKPATEIMRLADLSSVWLRAEVFESQAGWVAPSQSAEARLNYIPGEVFSGRVDYVYPILDPKTRTLQVRLRFDNPQQRLKPNMYGRVTIFGKSHPGALSIPREALIRGQQTDRVVVALGDGNFTVHEVLSGIESGNWVEILAGLEVGDEVVSSAQFLIDSEASVAGSIQRLDSKAPTHSDSSQATAYASGIVEAVDPQSRRVRISHGPIEQLGWAAMTMEFDVLEGSSLDDIRIGQSIYFKLSQSDVGDYVIRIVQPEEYDMGSTSSGEMDHSMHQNMDHGTDQNMDHDIHKGMDHGTDQSMDHDMHSGMQHDTHQDMDHDMPETMDHDMHADQPEGTS